MSILIKAGRPWVTFDVRKPEHRQWYAEFQSQNTWGHCPVRFISPDIGDLVTMIQRSLIDYYVNQEFGQTAS